MTDSSQKRAIRNYRNRLTKRGMGRFEVLGRDADRDLVRSFAKCLADDGPEAARLRAAVVHGMGSASLKKGGVLQALRRSPLVGAEIVVDRRFDAGRKVEL